MNEEYDEEMEEEQYIFMASQDHGIYSFEECVPE